MTTATFHLPKATDLGGGAEWISNISTRAGRTALQAHSTYDHVRVG
jgi:hypothetical protein